jgi:hypothetical protein
VWSEVRFDRVAKPLARSDVDLAGDGNQDCVAVATDGGREPVVHENTVVARAVASAVRTTARPAADGRRSQQRRLGADERANRCPTPSQRGDADNDANQDALKRPRTPEPALGGQVNCGDIGS